MCAIATTQAEAYAASYTNPVVSLSLATGLDHAVASQIGFVAIGRVVESAIGVGLATIDAYWHAREGGTSRGNHHEDRV